MVKVKKICNLCREKPVFKEQNCYQLCGRVTVVGVLGEKPVWSGHRAGGASCSVVQL